MKNYFLLVALICFRLCADSDCVEEQYEEKFEKLDKDFKRALRIFANAPGAVYTKTYRDFFQLDSLDDVLRRNSSEEEICIVDLLHTLLHYKELWALNMIDSFGKPQPGIRLGALKWPGNYDECIKVQSPGNETLNYDGFEGQYCTMVFKTKYIPMPISIGICLPDSCKPEDFVNANLTELIHNYTKKFVWASSYDGLSSYGNITSLTCQPKSVDWTPAAIGYLFLLSLIGLLVLLGSLCSIYEYFQESVKSRAHTIEQAESLRKAEHEENQRLDSMFKLDGTNGANEVSNYGNGNAVAVGMVNERENLENLNLTSDPHIAIVGAENNQSPFIKSLFSFFKCFSIFANGAKIISTENVQSQLSCLHGIRFLSMTWVILGHTYLFLVDLYSNLLDVIDHVDTLAFQVVLRGFVSVDSFFVLSGFLLTWLFLKEVSKTNGKINWVKFYVHRFWRLTPVYLIVMGFYVTMPQHFVSGPFAAEAGDALTCHTGWWWNILYINNFTEYNGMCMGWMWYLANDMQFYVISPIFLYALWRWPKIGFGIISALLVTCWISSGVITVTRDLPPLMAGLHSAQDAASYQKRLADTFQYLYVKPYVRIGPYLIGVLYGFLFYKTGDRRNFLTWWQQTLGWACASYLGLSIVYGLYNVDITPALGAVYNMFSCTAWGLAVGWVIYTCLTGHADIINGLLSWSGWIPLSRLTYCAYLIHPIIMHCFAQNFKSTVYFDHSTVVGYFATFILWTYGLSFAVSILFEAPAMALEKFMLKKKSH